MRATDINAEERAMASNCLLANPSLDPAPFELPF